MPAHHKDWKALCIHTASLLLHPAVTHMVSSQGEGKRGKLHLVKGKGTEKKSVRQQRASLLSPHHQSKAVLSTILISVKCKIQLVFLHDLVVHRQKFHLLCSGRDNTPQRGCWAMKQCSLIMWGFKKRFAIKTSTPLWGAFLLDQKHLHILESQGH